GGSAIYEKSTGLLIYGLFYYMDPFYGAYISYELEFEDTNAVFTYVTFDHELKAGIEIPSFCELGNAYTINATVFNLGLNTESTVNLILYLDGIIVTSTIIPSLSIGASSTINFEWSPTEFGIYNFTCVVPSISGEFFTDNNIITEIVPIKEIILFDGLYIDYLMNVTSMSGNANVSYTHIKESMFHVNWTQYINGDLNEGYWDVDAYTRLMTNMGGNTTFMPYQHTPIWIFNRVSLGDIVPIGVGFDLDHDFIVADELICDVPGYGPIEVWVLEDLTMPSGEAWYDKNTGILIKGSFYFFFLFFIFDYTMEMVNTNAISPQTNPPGPFDLTSTADSPDTDGDFDLTWTSSSGADNYSLYMDNNYITRIDKSLTSLAYQNATSPFQITGLTNGTYFFIIVAYNETGSTLSDCIMVEVQISVVRDTITVTTPEGTDSWETGSTHSITWTSTGSIANVKIELYKGGVLEREIVASTDNDGSFDWVIPTDIIDGTDYQIRISDVSDSATYDDSDNFTLTTVGKGDGGPGIPGYNLFFLLGILITISILSIRNSLKKKSTNQLAF
ncbi:MAG: Ser-Thr-rich GPI-anchored membrane family protein, partial [Candidatus Thorarchaeota archaeon]